MHAAPLPPPHLASHTHPYAAAAWRQDGPRPTCSCPPATQQPRPAALPAQVLLYPSKGEGMFVPESLIFRSDSNGEDLEGYAGAGARRAAWLVLQRGWRG